VLNGALLIGKKENNVHASGRRWSALGAGQSRGQGRQNEGHRAQEITALERDGVVAHP
jgi:hypothetical protein